MAIVLAIPDLHCSFQHPRAFEFLEKVYYEWKCDTAACLGDEIDAASFGKYPKDPDGYSPGMELALAIDELKKLYRIFPKMKVCTSNHTARPLKRAFEAGLPRALLKNYGEFLKAPSGWEWKDRWYIDNVLYHHGEGFSGQGAHIQQARMYRQSVVHGHLHSFGGVTYLQGPNDRIFGLNAGCLIDVSQYPFHYAKNLANRPTLGCGVIIDGQEAHFVPMPEKMQKIK